MTILFNNFWHHLRFKFRKNIYIQPLLLSLLLFIITLLIVNISYSSTLELKKIDFEFSDKQPDINLAELPEKHRKNIKDIIESPSLFRRVQSAPLQTNKYILRYLLNNLPFAAKISRGLKLSKYIIKKEPKGSLYFNDKKGLQARVDIIYKKKDISLFYGKGFYKGRIIKNLSGHIFFLFSFSEDREKNIIYNDISFYMKFDSMLMSTAVKIFSYLFNPLLKKRVSSYMEQIKTVTELITDDPLFVYNTLKENKALTAPELRHFKRAFLKNRKR